MDTRSQRAVDHVLECQDVGASLDGLFTAGRLQVDSAAPPIAELGGVGLSGPNDFHAGFLEMLAQAIEEAKPEHGRRKGRNLEDGMAEFALESLIDIRVVGEAENGRQADSDVVTIAGRLTTNLLSNLAAERVIFEISGNVDRGEHLSRIKSR